MIDQFPDASTVPVPRTVPEAFLRVIVLPTSPVPVIVGVESVVEKGAVVSASTAVTVGARGAVISRIVILTEFDGEVFPATSVAVISSVCTPSVSAGDVVIDHVPPAETVPVPIVLPDPSFIVMIAPTSPVPVIVGVVSLVAYGAVVSPPTAVIAGVRGGVISRILTLRVVGADVFPRASVAVSERVCVPTLRAVLGVIDQFPDASTVPVPRTVPEAFLRVIVLPTSPVPVIVGVVSGVLYGAVVSTSTAVTVGERGAVVSIVTLVAVTGETLPATSVAVISTGLDHSGMAVGAVHVQFPTAVPVPLQMRVPEPSRTRTSAPDSVVPENVGVASAVIYGALTSPPIAVTIGASGGVVSGQLSRSPVIDHPSPPAPVAVIMWSRAPEPVQYP